MSDTNSTELLGVFPSDWELVKLPDVMFFQEGPGITSDKFRKEGVPFLNIRCFVNGRIDRASCQFVSNQLANGTYRHFQLAANDWVFSSSGTIGKIAFIYNDDLPLLLNTSTIRFRTNDRDRLENRYIKVFLQSPHFSKQHRLQTQGSAQVNVGPTHLRRMHIPLPPTPEQSKIAEILSTVDRAIEQTEALIAKQQRIKTGLMQDLLTRGIDEHGNLRSEETHQFKDSPLGRIPVEWQVKELSEVVDENITYGIVQAGPHVDGGVPYIRTGDMAGDEINVASLMRTSPQIAKSYKRSAVWVGDIVFALRATVGKVLPVTAELAGANLTQGTAKISPKKSIDSTFLLWAMRTSQVQDAIRLEQKGTTFMEITLGDLRRIRLALPKEKDEQSLIAERLEHHDRLRRDYVEQREKLVSIKTGLMQDLLTGERRVTPLLEPAPDKQEAVT